MAPRRGGDTGFQMYIGAPIPKAHIGDVLEMIYSLNPTKLDMAPIFPPGHPMNPIQAFANGSEIAGLLPPPGIGKHANSAPAVVLRILDAIAPEPLRTPEVTKRAQEINPALNGASIGQALVVQANRKKIVRVETGLYRSIHDTPQVEEAPHTEAGQTQAANYAQVDLTPGSASSEVIKILKEAGGRAPRREIKKKAVEAGHSAGSISPALTRLSRAKRIINEGKTIYALAPAVPNSGNGAAQAGGQKRKVFASKSEILPAQRRTIVDFVTANANSNWKSINDHMIAQGFTPGAISRALPGLVKDKIIKKSADKLYSLGTKQLPAAE